VGCTARPLYPLPGRRNDRSKQPLQTFRAYNFAHRGSNGEFPEETVVAYMRAIEEGADFIESDVQATKDGVLVCAHDVILDDTTDIAEHKEFADRKTTYVVQGVNMTGYFIVDFTLEELKSLRTKQSYSFRDQQYNGQFPIITFDEYISIALDAPRVVGIYPEIKNPVFVNNHVKWPGGKKLEDKFVEILKKYGYKGDYMSKEWLKQPAFVQSFAPSSLIYISNLTNLPKIFLIDDLTIYTEDTNQSYWEITSDKYLNFIKDYVVGIGPWKDTIIYVSENYMQSPTDLVARAHAYKLQVRWAGGKIFEDKFVNILKKYGYKGTYTLKDGLKQSTFVQSFTPTSLIYVSNLTDLPKVLLIADTTVPTQDTNQGFHLVIWKSVNIDTSYSGRYKGVIIIGVVLCSCSRVIQGSFVFSV
ncbi:hypothetical protein ACH5RR_009000, partial [Cinchona calisaya]